jgi:hypothetical protein
LLLVRWGLPIQRWQFAMRPTDLVTFNMHEFGRLKVIQAVVDRQDVQACASRPF